MKKLELLIVTGMSGAGKTQAANALEDMGYYCVDNVPPAIIPSFLDLSVKSGNELGKIVIVTDVRGGNLFSEISDVLNGLKARKVDFKILFLDSSDEVLIRRYKENRRTHPLIRDNKISLAQAVANEREMLEKIRAKANYVIDTSYISISQLKEKLSNVFSDSVGGALKIQCKSFGFKYGADTEADLVIDVRCLINPFYNEALKNKTGLDAEICDYIMKEPESKEFYNRMISFLEYAIPLYAKEGKSQLIIAFGCTGGKHRSVTFARLLAAYLKERNYNCITIHRDINKR